MEHEIVCVWMSLIRDRGAITAPPSPRTLLIRYLILYYCRDEVVVFNQVLGSFGVQLIKTNINPQCGIKS